MVKFESGFLETMLISFKELLFFNVIKRGERVVIIIKVKLSIISAIKVTESNITIHVPVKWISVTQRNLCNP